MSDVSTMSDGISRSWAEIDRAALVHNLQVLRARLPAETSIMGVVKANAYGHGVGIVADAIAGAVQSFGVANLEEAIELRGLLPLAPILILAPSLPDERAGVLELGLMPSISDLAEAQVYSALAMSLGVVAPVHLIIDTGMGRIGMWEDEAPAFVKQVQELPGLRVAGLGSHLPSADEDEAYTREQLARFWKIATDLRARGLPDCTVHIENSAGGLGFPESAGDLVRAGLMLYGSSPLPADQPLLRQAMTWKTRITLVREVGAGRGISYGRTFITPRPMRVATLAVGYADGFRRHLTGRDADVLIRGRRCAVLGRVTMDQIVVDITGLPEVEAGEEVVLLGRQGDEEILALEMAEKAGTIAWDIFTGIGRRVRRVPAGLVEPEG
jgi:alanine racemase